MKQITMLLATPTNTLRRPPAAPNGIAISTTTRHVQGAASRPCQLRVQPAPVGARGVGMQAQVVQKVLDRHVGFLGRPQLMLSRILISLLISSGVSLNSGTASTLVLSDRHRRQVGFRRLLESVHIVKGPDTINAPRPLRPQLPRLRAARPDRVHAPARSSRRSRSYTPRCASVRPSRVLSKQRL